MKVLVFKDEDAVALLEQLELEESRIKASSAAFEVRDLDGGKTSAWKQASQRDLNSVTDQIHRRFHFVVTRWLQEQGAKTIR